VKAKESTPKSHKNHFVYIEAYRTHLNKEAYRTISQSSLVKRFKGCYSNQGCSDNCQNHTQVSKSVTSVAYNDNLFSDYLFDRIQNRLEG